MTSHCQTKSVDFINEIEKELVKDKILLLTAHGLKMVKVEDGVFQLICSSRTIYDTKDNTMKCFVTQARA